MLIAALLAPGVLRVHSQTGALSTLSPQPHWCLSSSEYPAYIERQHGGSVTHRRVAFAV